jgi:hypothetical protein
VAIHVPALILQFTAVGFIGFGVAYALWPGRMAALTEVSLPTRSARTDFAATYGGFQLGFGCFLLSCARMEHWLVPGLLAGAAALAGFAGIRILGILATRGRVIAAIWVALAIELCGLGLNLWALNRIA